MKEPKVSIILVNYNGAVHTKECIESLLKIEYTNYDIYIVDNKSTNDNFKDIMIEYENEKKICVIFNDKNLGFSGGNNVAIEKAMQMKSDYVLLLNNDTVVEKDFLSIMMKNTANKDNLGITTCNIKMYYEREKNWYAGGFLNKSGSATILYTDEASSDDITFVSGCCMLIPIEVIKDVGMLSEDYFLYFEDTDYCSKVVKKGYKLLYCSETTIYHKESVATGKKTPLYSYYFARNRLIYIRKCMSGVGKIYAYIYSLLWLMKKCVIREFKIKYVFMGIWEALRGKEGKREAI